MAIDSWDCRTASHRPSASARLAHIEEGSALVHDCRKAHNALVRDLKLADERYKVNPGSWVQRYAERFVCMKSENLQAYYLEWFNYLHRVYRDEKRWSVRERVVRYLALSSRTYLRRW